VTKRDTGGGTFDDPNREAIGQPPIWTGATDTAPTEPPPEGEVQPTRRTKSLSKDAPEQLELDLEGGSSSS
jgi:hypothetical protein